MKTGWLLSLARLSGQPEDWTNSPLRLRFLNAGLRRSQSLVAYFAAKSGLALMLPLAMEALLLPWVNNGYARLAALPITCALGYYAPNAWLSRRVSSRQRSIARALPEMMDLMVLCVEAGLSLEQAMERVARELPAHSLALAEELQTVSVELAAGSSRTRALRNLAMRAGLESLDSLVSLLVQSERFGTRVSDALRAQSEHLRLSRRQEIEMATAKVGLKLLVPLVFCIFPALLVVLAGPAFIGIMRALAA
jgi:tight adherence protein C